MNYSEIVNVSVDQIRELVINNNQAMSSLIQPFFLISVFFILIGAYLGYRYMDETFTGVFAGIVFFAAMIYVIVPWILMLL